jgi:hypothetical protein
MVHARTGWTLALCLAYSLAGCGGDELRDFATPGQAGNADSSLYEADDFDASSCDPSGLEGPLDASPVHIASALDQHCFNSGAGRRTLVIELLCARDATCAVRHVDECRAEYEARWQERQRPNGLSVPCADALLDSMSCLAQASCHESHACDEASKRAEAKCDPNAPLPGAPVCPPLPRDRELTKGPIPEGAINDAGILDETRVPDFVPAWDHDGEIAGYVRYCAIRTGGAIPVYADDLKTVVGHMIPGQGFVAGAPP